MIDTRKKEFWDATLEHCTQEERDYILSVLSADNTMEWVMDGCIEKCSACGEEKRFPHWTTCPACGRKAVSK